MTQYINMWKNAFIFNGTSSRSDYWMAVLFNVIASLVLSGIGSVIDAPILSIIYSVAVFIPGLSLLVRRLHDIGKSGAWLFIVFVPLIGSIWLLVLLCTPTNSNQYQTV